MPKIELRNVSKRFGDFVAVNQLNLVIEDGDFVSLLGPSGCGKTTTLRMIGGLETPTEGEILIDDQVVFSSEKGIDIAPDKRNVGFLFQNYALWPHMTVYKNIAFGLQNLKWEKTRIANRVMELLKMLKIEEFVDRYPAELSGGQQQRVAIARTLATGPKVLLMDEPLSNLDAKLRMDMRTELKRLHLDTDSTFVYVTHDQLEAMTLSTKVCLLKDGDLQQYESPLSVYHNPANQFAADFVGSPTMNFLKASGENVNLDEIKIAAGNLNLLFTPTSGSITLQREQGLTVGIRPEHIALDPEAKLRGRVYSTLPSGMETIVKIEAGGLLLTAVVFGSVDYEVDQEVGLRMGESHTVLFDAESNLNIGHGRIEIL